MNRYETTKKVGMLGIIGNIFLLIIKIIVAYLSHSQALIADATNSAGDIFSSLMTFIGNKIASIPNDEDHNFGHGKAEYIFSLLISIFMILIAIKILLDSISAIITKQEFIFSYNLIMVCLITIIIKFGLFIYCRKIYKNHPNILIKANMNDHRNDILLTIGTLISIILGSYGIYFLDGLFGSIISIYILLSGISIFLESYKILMDASLDKNEKKEIIDFILNDEKVVDVSDLYAIPTGYKYIIILTIDIDGRLNTFTSHKIADKLEKQISKNFRKIYKVIIHVNPVKIPKKK